MVHHSPEQLKRLVLALINPNVEFFIHVDNKVPLLPFVQELSTIPVKFISDRVNVIWGQFSQVLATLKLMEAAIKSDSDYFILLSGVDYPIKSNSQILDFFQQANNNEFIDNMSLGPNGRQEAAFRYQQYHFATLRGNNRFPVIVQLVNKVIRHLPKRVIPYRYKPYIGSSWWNLSKEAVNFILGFVSKKKKFVQFFKFTLCPDEMFFQTILLNSRFQKKIVNDNLRFIDWTNCSQGLSNSPDIITKNHLEDLTKSNALFARKFDMDVDAEITLEIENIRVNKP